MRGSRRFCTRVWTVLLHAALVMLCTVSMTLAVIAPARAQSGCSSGVCIAAGPRLVEVDSTQGPLLNALFQMLLPGTTVNMTVVDWNGIAGADINLNALITQLGTNLSLSDPSQVLDANITLGQLQAAMIQVLQADGQTAAANALSLLPLNIPGLVGTIKLADLLQISLPQGSLADIKLDVLDLITGFVQLYNFKNVATTPAPVTLDTAALGLPGVANLQVWAQVVEPPVYICGPEGTSFHSAAIRIKENTDLVQGFDLSQVITDINALGLGLSNITLTQSVLKLQLYADIARAEGTVTLIDAIGGAVTFNARPGLVGIYVGTIADSVFFNRSQVITDAIVDPVQLTTLNLGFDANLGFLNIAHVQVPLTVTVEAAGTGAPGVQTFTVNAPWPQTRKAVSGTVSAGTLVVDLVNHLDIQVTSGAPVVTVLGVPVGIPAVLTTTLLPAIVNGVEASLQATANTVLQPVFEVLLGGVVDNLLGTLGIAIGEAVFTVEGIARSCAAVLTLTKIVQPADDPGRFNLSISQGASVLASATDVGNGGNTGAVVTTPAGVYDLAEAAGTGTSLTPYISTWACTDQGNNPVSSGSGTSFSVTAPALSTTPAAITCRITNRALQADVSITKSDAASTYTPGGSSTYVITVSSAGPDPVTNAIVSDTLPNGATLSGPWSCTATTGTCNAASGGTAGDQAISVTVSLDAGGQATINVPVTFSTNPAAY